MQTVCTRLPLSLLTQEPGIKANDLYHSACRHLQENLYHLVVEMQMLWIFQANFYNIHWLQHRSVAPGWRVSITVCTCTRVGHNFCNSHGLVLSFMSTYEFWCICTLVNLYLGRAVEQLAGCLAKRSKSQQLRSKYNSMQCQCKGLKFFNKMM